MKVEREIKIEVSNFEPIRKSLKSLGFRRVRKVFERNYVLDSENKKLLTLGRLLRVRYEKDLETRKEAWILTYKIPKKSETEHKVSYEYETSISDGKVILKIFEDLGYKPFWIYEKIREVWEKDNLKVMLDEVPKLGKFVELEGDKTSIENTLSSLNFDKNRVITANYFKLSINKLGKVEDLRFEKV